MQKVRTERSRLRLSEFFNFTARGGIVTLLIGLSTPRAVFATFLEEMQLQRLRQRIVGAFVAFLVLISSVVTASAASWTEIGDAGNTPLTAQTPIGIGPLDTIIGTLLQLSLAGAEFVRAIPEPSSLIFFGLGLIGFAVASRKLTRRRPVVVAANTDVDSHSRDRAE